MKLLIADDEINIILLIKNLIDRCKINIEIAGEAGDGITALNLVRQLKPDVVITDIRMPGMSGMELIKQVRDEQLPVEFVIISGYSEFEYARSAIQYGVSDYLLKPIRREELNDVLARLADQSASKKEQQMQMDRMEDKLAANNGILRKNLLQNLIGGDEHLVKQALESLKHKDVFDFRGTCYAMAAVKLDCVSDPQYQVPKQAVETITAKIIRKLRDYCHDTEFIISQSWGYICMNYDSGSGCPDKIYGELEDMMEKTEYKNDLFEMTVGMGCETTSVERLPDSLDTAVRAVMLRIDMGVGSVIRYDKLPESYRSSAYPLSKDFEVKMERQIPLLIPGKLVLIGEESLSRAVEGQYHYYRLYGMEQEMLWKTHTLFRDIMKDYEIPDVEPYVERLENCTTLKQLKQVWEDYIHAGCELCIQQKDGMGSRPVRMIKEYIEAHYQENITLNDIADIVFLNPAYLSAMFRKETGQTLTQYLIHVRMGRAKEMLRNPGKSVGEIACAVGYQDERHFSKLFTRMTGVKPTEYRKFYV